jgi:hypothetical protein
MVDIVRMDHPLQIRTFLLRAPFQPLVDNNIVKYQIEQTIAKDPDADTDEIRIVDNLGEIVQQPNGGKAEYKGKKIIFFQGMIMNGMMRFVPAP